MSRGIDVINVQNKVYYQAEITKHQEMKMSKNPDHLGSMASLIPFGLKTLEHKETCRESRGCSTFKNRL
jgi:hypothetical protein